MLINKYISIKLPILIFLGVRCERASAFLRNKGIENVYQLDGGIHRYLESFPEDGGYWIGKNYTFDKRFSHGAEKAEIISYCIHCDKPWDRYQAQSKCAKCSMEVLLCKGNQYIYPYYFNNNNNNNNSIIKDCQKSKIPKNKLICILCK
jgi:predicted sulfurtransferase